MKNIIQPLKTITLALIIGLGIAYAMAWTGPTQGPPNGNVPAPVNVGSATQYKSGALGIGGALQADRAFITGGSWTKSTLNLYGRDVFTSNDEPLYLNYPNTSGDVEIGGEGETKTLNVKGNVRGKQLCIGGDCRSSWPGGGGGGSSIWTKSGNNIYYNAGDVSIGRKLYAAGDIRSATSIVSEGTISSNKDIITTGGVVAAGNIESRGGGITGYVFTVRKATPGTCNASTAGQIRFWEKYFWGCQWFPVSYWSESDDGWWWVNFATPIPGKSPLYKNF